MVSPVTPNEFLRAACEAQLQWKYSMIQLSTQKRTENESPCLDLKELNTFLQYSVDNKRCGLYKDMSEAFSTQSTLVGWVYRR